jgi:hypothetical protein
MYRLFLSLSMILLFNLVSIPTSYAQLLKSDKQTEKEKTGFWAKRTPSEAAKKDREIQDNPTLKERLFGNKEQQQELKGNHKEAKTEYRATKKERKAAEAREKAAKARADAIKAERRAVKAEKKYMKKDDKADKARSKVNEEQKGGFFSELFKQ